MKHVTRSAISDRHIMARLSAVPLVVGSWLVLTAAMAAAKVAPDDSSSAVLTGERDLQARPAAAVPNPVIGTESVPWTRYLLVAVIACLVGVLATLAIGFVVNRRRRVSMTHA
jgi:hypothetical protein